MCFFFCIFWFPQLTSHWVTHVLGNPCFGDPCLGIPFEIELHCEETLNIGHIVYLIDGNAFY